MPTLQSLEDSELLNKYIDNENEQAFNELYSRYHKKIFYFILKMVKDEDTANELTQQTYYKFLTKVDDVYEERGMLKSWIMRIAYNNCIDYFRSQKKFSDVTSRDEDDNIVDFFENMEADLDPEGDLIKQEDINILHKAITTLSKKQQEIVMLRMKYEMPFKEISELQGVSINTALGRMRYARINLKKKINEMDRDGTPDI